MKRFLFRLMLGILLWNIVPQCADAVDMLIPVGQVVGLALQNDTVTVAAFEKGSQAEAAGIQVGDRILTIDGQRITSAEDIRAALRSSNGSVMITLLRGDNMTTCRIHPSITEDGPKLGIYLKQGITGIGTITYYDPDTNCFGTLGHGVNDASGALLQLTTGSVYQAKVVAVRKGAAGQPGQLMGALTAQTPIGTIYRNTLHGVFATAEQPFSAEPLPVGNAASVTAGAATILSTVEGQQPREYSVEILKIYPASRQNGRNMLIRITDPALLATTGGIVQGMGVSYNKDNQVNP